MDHRDDLDARVAGEESLYLGGVDGVVVRDLDLVDLGAEIPQPVAHSLAEDPGDEIQNLGPRAHEAARGSLESENGFPLHQHHVVRGLQDLRHLSLGAAEALEEGWIVVIRDRRTERSEDARGCGCRTGAQSELGIPHVCPFLPKFRNRPSSARATRATTEGPGLGVFPGSSGGEASASSRSMHAAMSATTRPATSSTRPRPNFAARPVSDSSVWTAT